MNQYKIIINSVNRDKYLSNSLNDFTYTIPTFTDKVKSVYLESAQIYNSEYTIKADVNDELYYCISGSGCQIVTLDEGYYTAYELATAVQTKMNANPVLTESYTVTYNSVSNRFKIVCSNANFVLSHKGYYQPSAWVALGFLEKVDDGIVGSHDITSVGATQIAPYAPKLSQTHYKIVVTDLKSNLLDNTGSYPVCAVVPNDVSVGQLISYKPPFPFKIPTQNYFDATRIKIKILDELNNVAQLKNNFSLVLVMETY